MNKQNNNPNKSKIEMNPNKHGVAKNYEKAGYKLANKIHRIAVLSLVGFIIYNIGLFAYEYNKYWRSRRNPTLAVDMQKFKNI